MELLLILTAIFASLTGAASGDRGPARQVQGVAVTRSAQAAQAAVQPARGVIRAAPAPAALRLVQGIWLRLAAAPIRSTRLVFERRLE